MRAGRGSRNEPFVKAPLCADVDGFSLHAGVVVPGHDRERHEKLLRYAGQPTNAESRLTLTWWSDALRVAADARVERRR